MTVARAGTAYIDVRGDFSSFDRQTRALNAPTQKRFRGLGVAAKVGFGAGIAGAGLAVKKAFGEFREAEKATSQTLAVLKSTGNAAKVTAGHVEDLAQAISAKAGIDDEAIQSAENLLLTFTKVRNETGRGNQIFDQATRIVTDMSVALGTDLKSASIQVGKALQDPEKGITALRRVGVNFTAEQQDRITKWVEEGRLLKAQKFILRELSTEFGGSAAAQADAADRMKVALENAFESFGRVIGPTVSKAMDAVATFITQMQTGAGAGGKFASAVSRAFNAVKNTIGSVVATVRGFFRQHREDLRAIGKSVENVAKAIAFVWDKVVLPVMRRVLPGIITMLKGFARMFGGAIKIITGILTLDFKRAWEGVKDIFSGALKVVLGHLRAATAPFREIIARIGRVIGDTFGKALDVVIGAFKKIKNVVSDAVAPLRAAYNFLKKIGDVASKLGSAASDVGGFFGSIVPDGWGVDLKGMFGGPGGQGGALAFRGIAAGLGLGVSSGFRPGAVTRSGNRSYHSMGSESAPRAADYSGPAGGMMLFATLMAQAFGSQLKELIYTPLGFSIKDGKRTAPYAQADHMDHVHVALAQGGTIRRKVRALVGEEGPEIVDLPVGATVHPADKSRRLMGGMFAFARGGAVTAAQAAFQAGFRGDTLLRMVAIAGRESGYNPRAKNLKYPDHSIGLWQINQLAHKGRFGTDKELENPFTNARAAWELFKASGYSPWRGGSYASWMDDAAAAIAKIGKGGKGVGVPDDRTAEEYHVGLGGIITDAPGRMSPQQRTRRAARRAAERARRRSRPRSLPTVPPTKGLPIDAIWGTGPQGDEGDLGGGSDPALEEANRIAQARLEAEQERNRLMAEANATAVRIEAYLRTQGGSLLAGLGMLVSGQIGGNAGLGRQFPSFAGLGGLARS